MTVRLGSACSSRFATQTKPNDAKPNFSAVAPKGLAPKGLGASRGHMLREAWRWGRGRYGARLAPNPFLSPHVTLSDNPLAPTLRIFRMQSVIALHRKKKRLGITDSSNNVPKSGRPHAGDDTYSALILVLSFQE
jgi:hypothetical protein